MISGNHLLYSKLMMYLFSLFACKHLWQMTGPPSVQYVCNEVAAVAQENHYFFTYTNSFVILSSPLPSMTRPWSCFSGSGDNYHHLIDRPATPVAEGTET